MNTYALTVETDNPHRRSYTHKFQALTAQQASQMATALVVVIGGADYINHTVQLVVEPSKLVLPGGKAPTISIRQDHALSALTGAIKQAQSVGLEFRHLEGEMYAA